MLCILADQECERFAITAHRTARNACLHVCILVVNLNSPLPVCIHVSRVEEASCPVIPWAVVSGSRVSSDNNLLVVLIEDKAVCVFLKLTTRVDWEEV